MIYEVTTHYIQRLNTKFSKATKDAAFSEILARRAEVIEAIRNAITPLGFAYAPSCHYSTPDGTSAMNITAIEFVHADDEILTKDRMAILKTVSAAYKAMGITLSSEPDGVIYDSNIRDFGRQNRYAVTELMGHTDGETSDGHNDFASDLNTYRNPGHGKMYIVRTSIELPDTRTTGFVRPDADNDPNAEATISEMNSIASFLPARLEMENSRIRDILSAILNTDRIRFFTGAVMNEFGNPSAKSAIMRRADFVENCCGLNENEFLNMVTTKYQRTHDAILMLSGLNLRGIAIEKTDIKPVVPSEFIEELNGMTEAMYNFTGHDDMRFADRTKPSKSCLEGLPCHVITGEANNANFMAFAVFDLPGLRDKSKAWKLLDKLSAGFARTANEVCSNPTHFGLPEDAEDIQILSGTSDIASDGNRHYKGVLIADIQAPKKLGINDANKRISAVVEKVIECSNSPKEFRYQICFAYPIEMDFSECYAQALRMAAMQDAIRKMDFSTR